MLDKEIEIVVMSGVVAEVNNLPKGYTYKIKDLDEEEQKAKQIKELETRKEASRKINGGGEEDE